MAAAVLFLIKSGDPLLAIKGTRDADARGPN